MSSAYVCFSSLHFKIQYEILSESQKKNLCWYYIKEETKKPPSWWLTTDVLYTMLLTHLLPRIVNHILFLLCILSLLNQKLKHQVPLCQYQPTDTFLLLSTKVRKKNETSERHNNFLGVIL